ncbi:protein required for normal CLN1 and CLN2 G1 cyclin expression [Chytriomyces hyalinus]|nr:protein required for normal CLN1 and CLN2 G1 cyclin expression [Chytriomyces hyalinus]
MAVHALVAQTASDTVKLTVPLSSNALQAGSFFPDWGYACAANGEASEAAHWPAFWYAALDHLHTMHPPLNGTWGPQALPLLSFLLGAVSHGVTDYAWHSLDQSNRGFITALGMVAFNGSFFAAHKAADFGAEFALAHTTDLNAFLATEWHVPTGDLMRIYENMGHNVTVLDINKCMMQGFLATQAVRAAGRYLFPHWAQEAPPLIDMLLTYPHGGMRHSVDTVVSCWQHLQLSNFKITHTLPRECAGGLSISRIPLQFEGQYEQGVLMKAPSTSAVRSRYQFPSSYKASEKYTSVFESLVKAGESVASFETLLHRSQTSSPSNAVYVLKYSTTRNYTALIKSLHENVKSWINNPNRTLSALSTSHNYFTWHRITALRSIAFETIAEMRSKISAWLSSQQCHSIGYIQRVSKTSILATRSQIIADSSSIKNNPIHSNLGAVLVSGNFSGVLLNGTAQFDPENANQDEDVLSTPTSLVISASGYTLPTDTETSRGAVFILTNMTLDTFKTNVLVAVEHVASIILYGPSPSGLTATKSSPRFGSTAVVMDFNLDGVDDLVVSAPGNEAIYVFFGARGKGLGARSCSAEDVQSGLPENEKQCILFADRDADVIIQGAGVTEFGSVLAVGDIDHDGSIDLIVGCPFAGSLFLPNRGSVFAFAPIRDAFNRPRPAKQTRMELNDALWTLVPGFWSGMDFEEFGGSLAVVNGSLFVGSPGWRSSIEESAVGKVSRYYLQKGRGHVPILVGSVIADEPLTGFGRKLHVQNAINGPLLLISAPTQTSALARPKFMDLPGILTPLNSRGYSAGAIHFTDPASISSAYTSISSISLKNLSGSQSNARLGGSGLFTEGDEIWAAEALVDGEAGRVRRWVVPSLKKMHRLISRDGRRYRHPALLAQLFPNLECIAGAVSGEKFGVSVLKMDFDDDGGSDLVVASGNGLFFGIDNLCQPAGWDINNFTHSSMSRRNIEIPLREGDEVLIIDTAELTSNPTENDTILNILTNEKAPLALYLEFAKEFMRLGITDFVEKALQMAADRGAAEAARDQDYLKIVNTLALHFIESASAITKSENAPLRTQYLSKATELLNRADNLDGRNFWTAVAKGSLYLMNNKAADALKVFTFAVDLDSTHVAALMGLGAAQSRNQDFKSALKTYQKILKTYPHLTMPSDPRIAIGICYYRLLMIPQAHAAFTRALQLNPENVDALALLARLEWNEAREEGSCEILEGAVEKVKTAFGLDRKNSGVLNLVAEGLFFKRLFNQVDVAAKASVSNTDSNIIKAEAFGILAKSLHSREKYKEATEMYLKAATLNPSSVVYQYGLGQMYIISGENQKAIDCFDKVLAKDPDNIEALKKAASVCSEDPKLMTKCLEYFGKLKLLMKKLAGDGKKEADDEEGISSDPVLQVELARIYEGLNPSIALKGYLNALSLLDGAPDQVEILNNIGVLYHRDASSQKEFDVAKSYYDRALDAVSSSHDNSSADLSVTIRYNLARLQEQTGATTLAADMYTEILQQHPSYFDCYLRLASLAYPNFNESRDWIRKSLNVDRKTSLLMFGNSFYEDNREKGNLREARKSFEEVLQKADRHDHYALCNIGNIYLVIARFDAKQREIHIKKALEFFDKAVRVDSKNVFGATGVGICLAELGQYDHARDVFTQVLEGVANMPSISINLAHVLVELGQAKLAINHYERALKKTHEQNYYILQCLARVHYIMAKTDKDPAAMLRSLNCIQRAIHADPTKWALYYDLALIKQQYAQIMNDQPTEKRSVDMLKEALDGLHASKRIFTGLADRKDIAQGTPTSVIGYDIKQAKERASYCKDVQRSTEKRIHESTVLERERTARLKAIRDAQLAHETAEIERARVANEKAALQRDENERKRREIMARMQEENRRIRQQAELEEEEEAKKPLKRKKQDGAGSDESDAEAENGETGEKKEKRKKIRKRKEKKGKEDADGTRDDGDDDEVREDSAPRIGRQSNLSRAIIDSDDE